MGSEQEFAEMVQQPFVGPTLGQQQPQAAANAANTTLALPAIITNSQTQQQQSRYSPQTNYYQQQLIKSAQQQFGQQQQQQPRPNGIQSVGQQQQQQDSPVGQHQQAAHGLYNGRSAPIYAPKPSFYGQVQAQQQQPMYQPTATRPVPQQQQQAYYQQQQHSPASLALQANGQQVSAVGLSVRQLPPMQVSMSPNAMPASGLSPMQAAEQRQQQQMQQLIMSYQQQQQQQQLSEIMLQPAQQPAYLHAGINQSVQEQLVQQHVDVRWSHIEEQRQFQQQQQQLQQIVAPAERLGRVAAHRMSDRDSISTLSRFNQLGDRRSFTIRSQYTNANNANKSARQFSFIKLTGEALKRILGLGNLKGTRPLLPTNGNQKRNLHRNLNLSMTGTNGNMSKNSTQQQPFSTTSQHDSHQNNAKVTVIDSGEDYYFKRSVFKYQLVILRLISLLGAAFVLLSPVAMLLIPKMESLFGGHAYGDPQALSSSTSNQFDAAGQAQSTPSITHAVGLTGANRQAQHFAPQPQWRITECNSDCDGPLIGFVARLIILSIAYWAIFFRAQTATLPRIDFHRCLLTSMAVLLTLAYWLFFVFRVFDKRYNDFELQYMTIVQFSLSMLESLILLHYLAVVLLELRQRKKAFCLKVARSPDGASQYYSCGALSIQKCAQFVLEKYHRDFKHYGPYTEQLLELEDQLVQDCGKNEQGGEKLTRSRPSSPANSVRGGRASRRSTSMASRHHSRAGVNDAHHRSPSRSPVRSTRSRSQRKSSEAGRSNSRSNQVKLYQLDLNPPAEHNNNNSSNSCNQNEKLQMATSDKNATSASSSGKNFQESTSVAENKQHENDSNSADQSSDATSRMKESSLETIRAANSTSDLLSQQQAKPSASNGSKQSSSRINRNEDQQQQHRSTSRDETESVRSVRSRRSTARSHHRHRDHHHHRERSSSRANEHFDVSDEHRHSVSVSIPASGADPIEDHERKLRRRKFRLLASVQDAFEQIKHCDEADNQNNNHRQQADSSTSLSQAQQPKQALGPNQAARSLYPNIARSLQKYLRLTRQTGRHNLQSIYEHLSKCLLYGLSARTFLEKFVKQDPVWQQSETNLFANCRLSDSMVMYPHQRASDLEINSWSLVCDTLLSRQIDSGTFFVLKQGQVSLLISVARLPHLNLTEEVIDQKSCKFYLGPNSETSV